MLELTQANGVFPPARLGNLLIPRWSIHKGLASEVENDKPGDNSSSTQQSFPKPSPKWVKIIPNNSIASLGKIFKNFQGKKRKKATEQNFKPSTVSGTQSKIIRHFQRCSENMTTGWWENQPQSKPTQNWQQNSFHNSRGMQTCPIKGLIVNILGCVSHTLCYNTNSAVGQKSWTGLLHNKQDTQTTNKHI